MQWKVGDKVIYPGHLPGTIVVVHDEQQAGELAPAVLVALDRGGFELLLGPAEVAQLRPQPDA